MSILYTVSFHGDLASTGLLVRTLSSRHVVVLHCALEIFKGRSLLCVVVPRSCHDDKECVGTAVGFGHSVAGINLLQNIPESKKEGVRKKGGGEKDLTALIS